MGVGEASENIKTNKAQMFSTCCAMLCFIDNNGHTNFLTLNFFSSDINECTEGSHRCLQHQRCINTVGAYRCRSLVSCPPGYEPTSNNGCQGEYQLWSFLLLHVLY